MYKSSLYVLSVSSVSCISACVCLECLVLHTYVCICVYMSSLCIHVESICLVVSVSSVCHFSAWIYFECCVHMYVYAYISRVSIYVCYIISCICREHRSWVCRVFHTKNQKKKFYKKLVVSSVWNLWNCLERLKIWNCLEFLLWNCLECLKLQVSEMNYLACLKFYEKLCLECLMSNCVCVYTRIRTHAHTNARADPEKVLYDSYAY